ncbi:PAS domain S-box protein [Coleofasciculus sp.]|uniref:PAS domain S-box protein n=1 Tax=Coleofasciculus sp. TaxID=3100458 RepID=UPI0039F7ABB4
MTEPFADVFWLTSVNRHQLLYVNGAAEQIWGHTPEQLLTHPGGYLQCILNGIEPRDRERVAAAWTQQPASEVPQEYRIVKYDGSIRWVRSRSFIIPNPWGESQTGVPQVLLATITEDITEDKQIADTLNQREQEFRVLLDHSPDIVARFDRNLRHVYVNPVIEQETGIPYQDFLGKTHRELGLPESVIPVWEESLQTVFHKGEENESEFSFLTPHGQRYYQSRLVPEFAPDGSVEFVLSVCRDITEIQQAQQAVRDSEARFRTVFELAPIGMAIANAQGRVMHTNWALQDLLGYSADQLLNKSFHLFIHADDLTECYQNLQKLITGEITHLNAEKRYIHKQGHLVWVNVSVSAVRGANGFSEYTIALIQDISDRKQAEFLLQQAHLQLEQRVSERTAELEQANIRLQQEITHRQTIEIQLQQAKEQLQAVLDAVPGCVSWMNRQGQYLGVNQYLADMFNLSPINFVGQPLGFLNNNPTFVSYIEQFIESSAQTDQNILEINIKGSRRYHLIAAQKYQQGTNIVCVGIDVTQSQKSQQELQNQKDFLQTIIDTNPNLIHVKDKMGNYILANRMFAEHWGIPVEELLGKTTAKLHNNAADVERFLAEDQEILTTLQPKLIPEEFSWNHRGEMRWYQTIKTPLVSPDGQVNQVLGVSTDITARKLAEELLQQSEARLRLALDAAQMAKWDWNLQTGTITWSHRLEQLYGLAFDSPEIPYENFLEKVHPEDKELVKKNMQNAIKTGEDYDIEYRIIWPDQIVRWIQSKGQIIYDKTGQPIWTIGLNLDVTERKLAEEQLRQREEQLRLALDAARMGFWDRNLETEQITCSYHLQHLYGLDAKTTQISYETFLEMVHPEDRDRVNQADRRAIDQQEDCYDIEFRILRNEDNLRWVESKSQVFYDEAGQPVRVMGINLDITERKQAEIQIQASLREKEVLLQEIHHRVKNNLQVISSLLDLQSQYITDPTTVELFQESQNRVKSMALVHEKLYQSQDFARINFAEYIENLTSYLFQIYIVESKQVNLEFYIHEVNLTIDTAIPCGLIISELVSNALKYAFPDDREGTIEVFLTAESGDRCHLTVKDNGVGFPPNLEFAKPKSLGLQLINVLTEQLEGDLSFNLEKGTEVNITFPIGSCNYSNRHSG